MGTRCRSSSPKPRLPQLATSPQPPTGAALSVLICDDVHAMRTLLRVVIELDPRLRVAGEARDGSEAISLAQRVQPDVVLLDLSMPIRSGLEALPEIKAVAPAAQIIAFSGLDRSVVENDALQAGASRFLQKGADPDEILAAIEATALSGRRVD